MNADASRFRMALHDRFIRMRGERVLHAIGMFCPYGSEPDPARHDVRCPHCGGYGIVWVDERPMIGIVTDVQAHKELLRSGVAMPGDAVFSPESKARPISDWDRIILPWPLPFEGERLVRGDGPTDRLLYESAAFRGRKAIACFTSEPVIVDPNQTRIDQLTSYFEGQDFVLEGRTIRWLAGKGPPVGTAYTLKYYARIEWIAFIPPVLRIERGQSLGQRVLLRRRHLIRREAV